MRTGLLAFGVIFLVFGAVLYFLPSPTAAATTTNVGTDGASTKTSYASVSMSWQLTLALALVGVILIVLGATLPEGRVAPHVVRTERTAEHTETGKNGKRKTIDDHHEVVEEAD